MRLMFVFCTQRAKKLRSETKQNEISCVWENTEHFGFCFFSFSFSFLFPFCAKLRSVRSYSLSVVNSWQTAP